MTANSSPIVHLLARFFVTLLALGGCSLGVDGRRLQELESRCDAGACGDTLACTGCWDGVACLPGTSANGCGFGGGTCQLCAAPTDACREGQCVASASLIALAAGGQHTCAADSQRKLWCWGDNSRGQLAVDQPKLATPEVVAVGEWVSVAAAGANNAHTCAIHYQGSLWCWGDNTRGQLGLGIQVIQSSRVREVLSGGGWARVSTGPFATCAVRNEGTLWCWGASDDGRLGRAGSADQGEPGIVGVEADWREVAVGDGFAYAIKRDGSLFGWGRNDKSQLGNPNVPAASSRPVGIGSNYVLVSAGTGHGCGIRTDKSLWCWGDNAFGQAGPPPDVATIPQPREIAFASIADQWIQVVTGQRHTCAVTRDGQLWCWGANDMGQIGDGGLGAGVVGPVRIQPDRRWRDVAAGDRHTCAQAADGTLWCWGDGAAGQTGLNRTVLVPTQVLLQAQQ